MSKELYIAEVERLMAEQDLDYDTASERAYESMRDRLAAWADREKQRLKDEGRWPASAA